MLTLLKKIIGKVGFTAFKSDKSIHTNLHDAVGHDDTSVNKMTAGRDINVGRSLDGGDKE